MIDYKKTFETIRTLYKNRLQRLSFCRNVSEENQVTEEEVVLGSKEKVHELGQRFLAFENDETFLEDALTFYFVNRKMSVKSEYSFEEVVGIVKDAMAERNIFLRECAKQYKDSFPSLPM